MTNPRTLQNLERAIARTAKPEADVLPEESDVLSNTHENLSPISVATPTTPPPRQARKSPPPKEKIRLKSGALGDPQPDTFQNLWVANPAEMPLYEHGFDGELAPSEEWLGDSALPGFEVIGQFGGEDFSLVLSGDLITYLKAQLPEQVDLEGATPRDRALLFEHFLTPLMTTLEDKLGHEISFSEGHSIEPAAVNIDVFAMLNSDGGGFPVGLQSQSSRLWSLLHSLNAERVAGLVKRDVQISFGSVLLSPADVAHLGPGDVIVLEEAQGPELRGDLLIEGQTAHSIVVTPNKAVIVKSSDEEEFEPDPNDIVLSFVPATLALTDNEIIALKPGTELSFNRPENGAVDILFDGKSSGTGNLVLQDGSMGIKVREIKN